MKLLVVLSAITSAFHAQLAPSGEVLVCPDAVLEITCNVTVTEPEQGLLQWTVMSQQIESVPYIIWASLFNQSLLGVPLPQSPRAPGITVTPHIVSSALISATMTVETANYDLHTLGPIEMTCAGEHATIRESGLFITAILLYTPVSCEYKSTDRDSSLVTLFWSSLNSSVNYYIIAISPPPPSFSQPVTTITTTLTLTLSNSLTYTVTITSCKNLTTNFTLSVFDNCTSFTPTTITPTTITTMTDTTSSANSSTTTSGTTATEQMSPGIPSVPIIVAAVVVVVVAISLIVVSCTAAALAKRSKSGALIMESNATAASEDSPEEYSTLNLPKLQTDKNETTTEYDYCTVRGELPPRTTRNEPSRAGCNYSEVEHGNSMLQNALSLDPAGMVVSYTKVKVNIEPEDKLLNLDSLVRQLHPVQSKWKAIGEALNISREVLEDIQASCAPEEDLVCLVEMCDKWIKTLLGYNLQPTWQAVGKALVRADCQRLSKEIMDIYKTGMLPQPGGVVSNEGGSHVSLGDDAYDDVRIETRPPPPIPPQMPVGSNYDDVSTNMTTHKDSEQPHDDVQIETRPPPPIPPQMGSNYDDVSSNMTTHKDSEQLQAVGDMEPAPALPPRLY